MVTTNKVKKLCDEKKSTEKKFEKEVRKNKLKEQSYEKLWKSSNKKPTDKSKRLMSEQKQRYGNKVTKTKLQKSY